MQLVLFVYLIQWRNARNYQRDLHLIIQLNLDNYWWKKLVYFIEMQLIYLIDIFEDNYNIVRDSFEIDSTNVMKIGCLLQRNKGNFSIH